MSRARSVVVLRESQPRVFLMTNQGFDMSRAEAIRRSLAAHEAANTKRSQSRTRQPWQWLRSVWEAAR